MSTTDHRTDFLKAGTLAKGSAETGEVESYMCAKVKRSPIATRSCAEYLGYFTVGKQGVGDGITDIWRGISTIC